MKILITGQNGLAQALAEAHCEQSVTCVSRRTGHDIHDVANWGHAFVDYDMVYNCAYNGLGQLHVLEFFYEAWKTDAQRTIVNIGSRVVSFPRSDGKHDYLAYHTHKIALLKAYELMLPVSRCMIKMINPGPIDTDMVSHLPIPKIDPRDLARNVRALVENPLIRRADLWL